ncbi:MAG: YkgJ family cysteine cluster protein [Desulfobulbaceae bacterium]|nr:YkgJ family cysteine cluster protein [Desulfobulbaceae bacterium]
MRTRDAEKLAEIFSCTMCGYCCHGETTVSLDQEDQENMAGELGLDQAGLLKTYLRKTGNVVQMRIEDGHCIFYNGEKGCTVHQGRPWRCRQWPLHPSILFDPNNFETIRSSCPGIDQEISYDDFCRILRELLDAGVVQVGTNRKP